MHPVTQMPIELETMARALEAWASAVRTCRTAWERGDFALLQAGVVATREAQALADAVRGRIERLSSQALGEDEA